jgi:serine/threonine-protein kinase
MITQSISVYRVTTKLGAGGMDEVRDKDTRLDREVAIKILPESFADDPRRTARFLREAEVGWLAIMMRRCNGNRPGD